MAKYQKKNLQTEEKIKKAYMKLYAVKTSPDITVTDICREACINRCTFYLHYDNTKDLDEQIRMEILSETSRRTKHLSRHNIYEAQRGNIDENLALVDVLSYFRDNREYMIPLLMPGKNNLFREDLRASISELFYAAFLFFGQSFGSQQEYVLRFITGGIVDDIYLWLVNGDKSVEEMSDFFMRTTDLFPVVNMRFRQKEGGKALSGTDVKRSGKGGSV